MWVVQMKVSASTWMGGHASIQIRTRKKLSEAARENAAVETRARRGAYMARRHALPIREYARARARALSARSAIAKPMGLVSDRAD